MTRVLAVPRLVPGAPPTAGGTGAPCPECRAVPGTPGTYDERINQSLAVNGSEMGEREYDYIAGWIFSEWRLAQPHAARLSRAEVARRIGVGRARVKNIELGRMPSGPHKGTRVGCTAAMRARLAKAVGVEVRVIWPNAPECREDTPGEPSAERPGTVRSAFARESGN